MEEDWSLSTLLAFLCALHFEVHAIALRYAFGRLLKSYKSDLVYLFVTANHYHNNRGSSVVSESKGKAKFHGKNTFKQVTGIIFTYRQGYFQHGL